MAVIPSFLLKKNWLNANSMMIQLKSDQNELEMPMLAMPELNMPDQITETNGMSPAIMVVIGASVFAVVFAFVCFFSGLYFFWKHKPHKEVEKRSKIYMRKYF